MRIKTFAVQSDNQTDSSSISLDLPCDQRSTGNTSEDDEDDISDNETPPPSPSSSETDEEDEKEDVSAQTGWTTVINDVQRDSFSTLLVVKHQPRECSTVSA